MDLCRGDMMCDDVARLADRMGRLEAECRRWRRVALAALIGVPALMLVGARQQPDVLSVGRLAIVDKAGNSRIVLDASDESIVGLSIIDAARQTQIFLGTNEKAEAALHLYEAGINSPRLSLAAYPKGVTVATLANTKGHRIGLATSDQLGATIRITDPDRKLLYKAP